MFRPRQAGVIAPCPARRPVRCGPRTGVENLSRSSVVRSAGCGNVLPRHLRIAILGLAVLSGAILPGAAQAEVIRHDLGGDLDARVAQVEGLRATGTQVRIEGLCVSACTLYLGLPNACVMPGAQLGFHGPRTRLPGIPLPAADFERQTRVMAGYYPGAIRAWFMAEARMITTSSYFVISGAQAIDMGARGCS